MIKYYKIYLLFLIVPIYSTDVVENNNKKSIDFFKDDRVDDTILHFDHKPLFRTSFLFDKYNPNHFSDFGYYNVNISGSLHDAIYQMIPDKIYFDISNVGKLSQLSYMQKKSEDFFNTRLAMKNNLKDDLRFIGFMESKSFLKDNINQNILLNINKETYNGIFDMSYMYHYDDSFIKYAGNSPCLGNANEPLGYQNYNITVDCFEKENESYFIGYNITQNYKKISFNHQSSYQISGKIINNNNYDGEFHWHNDNVRFSVNDKIDIYLKQKYKRSILKSSQVDNYNGLDVYVNTSSFGLFYEFLSDVYIDLGVNKLVSDDDSKSFEILSIGMRKPKYSLIYHKDAKILSDFINVTNVVSDFEPRYSYNKRESLSIGFSFNSFIHNIELGKMNIDYLDGNIIEYDYYLTDGLLKFNWFAFEYDVRKYDHDVLHLNEISNLKIILSPNIKSVRYNPYASIGYTGIGFNSGYNIDLGTFNVFNEIENGNSKYIKYFNLEMGLVFETFKISYKLINPYKTEKYGNDVQFSDNLLPLVGHYSYIDLIWLFKD